MNNNTIITALLTFLIGGLLGYGIANKDTRRHMFDSYDENEEESIPFGMHRMPDGSMMGNAQRDDDDEGFRQMGHMMNMMVSSEREFIEGMIPHHQEAVDTAKEVIARGGSTPEIKALVENIVTSQEAEITNMKSWYQDWYGEAYRSADTYEPMMRDLATLSGAELDKVFLEDMIMHHMGAIMMARSVQVHIEHDEIANLSDAIISNQAKEISQMRQMLQRL